MSAQGGAMRALASIAQPWDKMKNSNHKPRRGGPNERLELAHPRITPSGFTGFMRSVTQGCANTRRGSHSLHPGLT